MFGRKPWNTWKLLFMYHSGSHMMLRVRNIQACTTIKEACRPCNILDNLSLFAERKPKFFSFSEDLRQILEMVVSYDAVRVFNKV
jgi:hypothetical protein